MTECDVCIYTDGEPVEFFFGSLRKCRKPCKCEECGRPIARGTLYHRVGGKFEGEMWTMKVCTDCKEIGDVFYCEGRLYGILWEDMRESVFERLTTASPCFTKLSPAAKQFVLEKWKEWKF